MPLNDSVGLWIKKCIILILFPSISIGQIPYPSLKLIHFSVGNGLSNNKVKCLIQDKQGFLWVGTTDGLNRFDGVNFVVYRKQWKDSASFSSNVINALTEDSNHRIWIGTDEGL